MVSLKLLIIFVLLMILGLMCYRLFSIKESIRTSSYNDNTYYYMLSSEYDDFSANLHRLLTISPNSLFKQLPYLYPKYDAAVQLINDALLIPNTVDENFIKINLTILIPLINAYKQLCHNMLHDLTIGPELWQHAGARKYDVDIAIFGSNALYTTLYKPIIMLLDTNIQKMNLPTLADCAAANGTSTLAVYASQTKDKIQETVNSALNLVSQSTTASDDINTSYKSINTSHDAVVLNAAQVNLKSGLVNDAFDEISNIMSTFRPKSQKIGKTGPDGNDGPVGKNGKQGPAGKQGKLGKIGITGTPIQGPPGPTGPTGPTGTQGVSGAS